MVQWVWEAASQVPGVEVVVATDDERIRSVVEGFGGKAVMTSPDCPSGTDRVAVVARASTAEHIINLQGDEPLCAAGNVAIVADLLKRGEAMATLDYPLAAEAADDPNTVKVVKDALGYALYFSRSPIPHPRNASAAVYRKHLGIYGYHRDTLFKFVALAPTMLERAESLEQLRALENGIDIFVAEAAADAHSVDTLEDAKRVEELLKGAR